MLELYCNLLNPALRMLPQAPRGMKKWVKGIFLGKTEGQDAFIIYDGNKVLLTFPVMGSEPGLLEGLFMSHL